MAGFFTQMICGGTAFICTSWLRQVRMRRSSTWMQTTYVKEWLKPYVDMNTELRNKCKKEGQAIGTIVYKLMSNAIYGKFSSRM